MGLYLAVSLRGQAQGVFGNISTQSEYYDKLVLALEERFVPPKQTELYRAQLRERRQTASETLSAMEHLKIYKSGLPNSTMQETLAKEQFIDALHSSDMRVRVKQTRPSDLNDAVRHTVELEEYNRVEKKKTEGEGYLRAANMANTTEPKPDSQCDKFETLTNTLKLIQDELKSLKHRSQNIEVIDHQVKGDLIRGHNHIKRHKLRLKDTLSREDAIHVDQKII